jgi:GNAT superfamily N-acetyltransferase
MNAAGGVIALSQVDSERFGVPIARASLVAAQQVDEVARFCVEHGIAMAIVRCATSDLVAVQDLERHGFRMMDTLIYYAADLEKRPIPEDKGQVAVRPLRTGEEEMVRQIAASAFTGYFGHYHADPRLDRAKCDEAYISWSVRSCVSREVAGEVLVADRKGELLGFATLRMNDAQEGEGVLFGVAPQAQGLGIYRSFMVQGMRWCKAQGARRMVVSTQITNLAVQKVWCRVGFEPSRSYYTLHKWFDE